MVNKTIVLLLVVAVSFTAHAETYLEALNDIVGDAQLKKNICCRYQKRFKKGLVTIPYDTVSIKKRICPHKNNYGAEYLFLLGLALKKLNNKFQQELSDTMVHILESFIKDAKVISKLNAFVHGIYIELWEAYDKRAVIKNPIKDVIKKPIHITWIKVFDQQLAQWYLISCAVTGCCFTFLSIEEVYPGNNKDSRNDVVQRPLFS